VTGHAARGEIATIAFAVKADHALMALARVVASAAIADHALTADRALITAPVAIAHRVAMTARRKTPRRASRVLTASAISDSRSRKRAS
jgi:hypothetical protein